MVLGAASCSHLELEQWRGRWSTVVQWTSGSASQRTIPCSVYMYILRFPTKHGDAWGVRGCGESIGVHEGC